MNEGQRELRRGDGSCVQLTTAEFDLLCVFLKHPLRPLSRADVMRLAPPRAARETGRSIDVTISRLRRKIESNPRRPALIKTVRDQGYMLTTAVARGAETLADTN